MVTMMEPGHDTSSLESLTVRCFPKLVNSTKDTRQITTPINLEIVPIAFVKQEEILSQVNLENLAAYVQLTWTLILRHYTGEAKNVAFGVLQRSGDILRSRTRCLGLAESVTVSDAVVELTKSDSAACTDLTRPQSVHTAVLVERRHRLSGSQLPIRPHFVAYDDPIDLELVVEIGYGSNALVGYVHFDPRQIEKFHALSLSSSFGAAFSNVLSSPLKQLEHVSCFADPHRDQIRCWNDVHLESWPCKLDHIFKQTVRDRPQDCAIESYDGKLSFEELDHLSNSVALKIRQAGVETGDFVGHCFNLGSSAIVTTLAIFKAGCVSVPLDPTHPLGRHSTILEAAHVKLLLSDTYQESEGQVLGIQVISVDTAKVRELMGPSKSTSDEFGTADDSALICFTSGSTGVPKGIVQTHSGLATMVRALVRQLRIDSTSRVSGLHPYIFDVSIMEIFTAFLAGAVLCIPRKEDMMIPQPLDLGRSLARFSVTHAVMSPTMLKTLEPARVPDIYVIMSMGESLDLDLLSRWGGREKPQLLQLWGTTEASILQSCTPPLQAGDAPHMVGKALPGTCRLWIVDQRNHHRLVPIGAVGELLVESPALAAGYLDDEAKTNRSFLTSPNWLDLQQTFRVYRTGDLARYNPDGSILFMGRSDRQINFHGERVELGEIDYRLLQLRLPGVTDIFCDFVSTSQTIVAFCCLEASEEKGHGTQGGSGKTEIVKGDLSKLSEILKGCRTRLCQHLPSYMVPQFYFPLSRRPVTATGKTDRKALQRQIADMAEPDLRAFADLDR